MKRAVVFVLLFVVASFLLEYGGNLMLDGLGYCFQGALLVILLCWIEYQWRVIKPGR